MTPEEFDYDNLLESLSGGEFSIRELRDLSPRGTPLIRVRRGLERLKARGLVRARKIPAKAHASRGPRPLLYSLTDEGRALL